MHPSANDLRTQLAQWQGCRKCTIGEWARKHVPGRGQLPCDLLCVGEGPGKSEDVVGLAFVGPAGRLLDKAIPPETKVYYTNLLMCRPCDSIGGQNRPPSAAEVAHCTPRLGITIAMAKPKAALLLGKVPAFFLGVDGTMAHLLGNIPRLQVHHPAFLARRGGVKATEWVRWVADIEAFIQTYCEA